MVTDYRYHVYVDRGYGKGMELSSWHDDMKSAEKEVVFMTQRGYKAEIRKNK